MDYRLDRYDLLQRIHWQYVFDALYDGDVGTVCDLSGAIAILRTYALQCVAAPTGGAIADKIGSVTLVIGICFVIIVAALAGFVLLPASPQYCHDRPGADAVVLCRDLCYAGHLLCTHGRMQRAEAFDGNGGGRHFCDRLFPRRLYERCSRDINGRVSWGPGV